MTGWVREAALRLHTGEPRIRYPLHGSHVQPGCAPVATQGWAVARVYVAISCVSACPVRAVRNNVRCDLSREATQAMASPMEDQPDREWESTVGGFGVVTRSPASFVMLNLVQHPFRW